MEKSVIHAAAHKHLKKIYGGETASFREGQYEAIEATLSNRRSLVVQKTGWGKSLVYFISSKINREAGAGATFVVSPLLVLMDNQSEAASKMDLVCRSINSNTKDDHETILKEIQANKIDVVFVTPESLFNDAVQKALPSIQIGLFVIDEAHCISDWGHDFRLTYGKLKKILQKLPSNIPVLATTATANLRVVADLEAQMGKDVFVSRGELMRKNLTITVLPLSETAQRYAWLLENLPKLQGTGIIYCTTVNDCIHVTNFLKSQDIKAMDYYSRPTEEEIHNTEAEHAFYHNEIKVIVATIKLGMGYDKGDISFVIHFQQPGNIITYYQQIGRAGRNIPLAQTFLMTGAEDKKVHDYFIRTAFPTKIEHESIYQYILEHTDKGVRISELYAHFNMKLKRIKKVLYFLESDGHIIKENSIYRATGNPFQHYGEKYQQITEIRKKELRQMDEFTLTDVCYNRYIVNSLDDMTTGSCGVCANCLPEGKTPVKVSPELVTLAQNYLNRLQVPIKHRVQWPYGIGKPRDITICNVDGICLSKYGDSGFGTMVRKDKYGSEGRFRDTLVSKSAETLQDAIKIHKLTHITYVPSLRSDIVRKFAENLSTACGLPCVALLSKTDALPQKNMENPQHQCENALKSFHLAENVQKNQIPQSIILIDDVVDSKWTLTVCGDILCSNGAKTVFPFALADSSSEKEQEND